MNFSAVEVKETKSATKAAGETSSFDLLSSNAICGRAMAAVRVGMAMVGESPGRVGMAMVGESPPRQELDGDARAAFLT